jgi:hypothetical protein
VKLAAERDVGRAIHHQFMAPIWDKLAKNNVRSVIGVASWDLVEPVEGRFHCGR